MSDDDTWVQEMSKKPTRNRTCSTCDTAGVSDKLNEYLRQMAELGAKRITISDLYSRLAELFPAYGLKTGKAGLQKHLNSCCRELWDKAKGRP